MLKLEHCAVGKTCRCEICRDERTNERRKYRALESGLPIPSLRLPYYQSPKPFTPATWGDEAACKGMATDRFFDDQRETSLTTRVAQSVCRGCPVNAECLAYALTRREQHGIWGGLTERQRRNLGNKSITVEAKVELARLRYPDIYTSTPR